MEFSLSPSQSRILLAELNHPGTLAYHLYFRMDFGKKELPWLVQAVKTVISGNFGLRVRSGESGYVQYYSDERPQIERIDLNGKGKSEIDEQLKALQRIGIASLFDAPLYRLYLIETNDSAIVFITFHHLIVDGTTLNRVLPRRLRACVDALKRGRRGSRQSRPMTNTFAVWTPGWPAARPRRTGSTG